MNSSDARNGLTLIRARALASAGRMAWFEADFAVASAQLSESLALFRTARDIAGMLEAISGLILVLTRQGDYEKALTLVQEAQSLLPSVRGQKNFLPILAGLGRATSFMVSEEALPIGRKWSAEAADMARVAGDKLSLAWSLDGLAICDYYNNELKLARAELEEGIPLFEELGDLWGVSLEKWLLSNIARRDRHWDESRTLNREALTVQSQHNSRQGTSYMLDSFAYLAIEERQPQRAVRLLSAAQNLRDHLGSVLQPLYVLEHEEYLRVSRDMLPPTKWALLWDQGRKLTAPEAIALAIEEQN